MSEKTMERLSCGNEVHYYSLMAWNGMTSDEAFQVASTADFFQLGISTASLDSINEAVRGIERHLLLNKEAIDMDYVTGSDEAHSLYLYSRPYFLHLANLIDDNFAFDSKKYDAVIAIIEEIHDKWVTNNAAKYDRDANKEDKRLYQHLPLALIGIKELAKDLVFLEPILSRIGISVGYMEEKEWGTFIPNKTLSEAYDRYVEQYKKTNELFSLEKLKLHLENITESYIPLFIDEAPPSQRSFAEKRVKYVARPESVSVLLTSIIEHNRAFRF